MPALVPAFLGAAHPFRPPSAPAYFHLTHAGLHLPVGSPHVYCCCPSRIMRFAQHRRLNTEKLEPVAAERINDVPDGFYPCNLLLTRTLTRLPLVGGLQCCAIRTAAAAVPQPQRSASMTCTQATLLRCWDQFTLPWRLPRARSPALSCCRPKTNKS